MIPRYSLDDRKFPHTFFFQKWGVGVFKFWLSPNEYSNYRRIQTIGARRFKYCLTHICMSLFAGFSLWAKNLLCFKIIRKFQFMLNSRSKFLLNFDVLCFKIGQLFWEQHYQIGPKTFGSNEPSMDIWAYSTPWLEWNKKIQWVFFS